MRGVTLIELVITLAIAAMLMLVGVPLTAGWIDGSRQMHVRAQATEAVAQARALALRNPGALPAGTTGGVARLELVVDDDRRRLQVRVRNADGSWRTAPEWQAELPAHRDMALKSTGIGGFADLASFRADGNLFSCVAFDSHGHRTDAPGCALVTQERIAIGAGNQALEYVELL
ncbi:type II secretion system protein [Luteimonas yindakuii]|nr:prepilin-type N-terminal cleavage/methylation domain-containing protein [Luteimonas yindakuii]